MRSTEPDLRSARSAPPVERPRTKKLYYKIGNVCEMTGTQPYILRFWESEFPQLAPQKSRSGQRLFRGRDIEIVQRIKHLLYEEGYTIAGARRRLEQEETDGALRPSAGPPTLEAALPDEVHPPEPEPQVPAGESVRATGASTPTEDARGQLRRTQATLRKLRRELETVLRRLGAR